MQTDFEDRVDNSSQQFGVEQIMRFLGAPSVKTLPSVINLRLDESRQGLPARSPTSATTTPSVARAKRSSRWAKQIDSTDVGRQAARARERGQREAEDHRRRPQQVTEQLKHYQEQELEKVFTNMKRVGGRPAVDYCLAFAHDKGKSEKMRTDALAALENRVDKNNPSDVNALFDILRRRHQPRQGPRASRWLDWASCRRTWSSPRLYTLFDKKWQVRLDAARLVFKTMTTKDVPDFMRHLPANDKTRWR